MTQDRSLVLTWIRVGIVTGFCTSACYPLMIFVSLPRYPTLILAAAFGPLLATASIGLYHLLTILRKSVKAQIAVLANLIAGTIVNLMLIVQMAVRASLETRLDEAADAAGRDLLRWIWRGVDQVQLGLDVSWDIFLGVGTLFFALCMFKHPRFGKVFSLTGAILALLLLAFNFYSFPVPPAESGSIDFGPLAGLWYLAVTIQSLRSLKWAEENT